MTFRFPKGTNWVGMPEPTNRDSVRPLHYLSQQKYSVGVMLSSISRTPLEVPGKADEIIRQASLCTFVSFL